MKTGTLLKTLRRIAAIVFGGLLLLFFLDFTRLVPLWFHELAQIQLIPALVNGMIGIVALWIVATLLLGRVYCSVLCPLGAVQDGVSWLSGRRKGRRARFGWTKPVTWLRWTVLGLVVVAGLLGLAWVVGLVDPWAIFGRAAGSIVAPGVKAVAGTVSYAQDVYVKSFVVLAVAVVTLAVMAVMAWRRGRTWCNTMCPVGTLLGLVARVAPVRMRFDEGKCTQCGVCEKKCRSGCIDSEARRVDYSRCVVCFDCVESCNFGAMKYSACKAGAKAKTGAAKKEKGVSRRAFLTLAGTLAAAGAAGVARAQQPLVNVDGGLADIEKKQRPGRKTPVTPPGSGDARNVARKCTACQLCVTVCPNNVLRPSTKLETLMQPEMSYERGYCRPECVECGQVCPTGAIERITKEEKTGISIGNAVWAAERCVVNRDQVPCTECERHCPTKAIMLVPKNPADPKSLKIPTIDNTRCIGCGACEHLCPARPQSAIWVEGNVTHHEV